MQWTDELGQAGDLSTLPAPVTELAVGSLATWVTGPYEASLAPDETRLETTIRADWTGTNNERLADPQTASSAAGIIISHPPGPAVSLTVSDLRSADAAVSPGADADLIAFGLTAAGRLPVLVTGFRLDSDIEHSGSGTVELAALLESLAVMLGGSELASDAIIGADGVALTLTAPLVVPAGDTAAVTIQATTSPSLAQQLAGGVLASAGLAVAVRARRQQLLLVAAILLILASCSGGRTPQPTIRFSVQLSGVTSNSEAVPAGLPLPGPTISVTY